MSNDKVNTPSDADDLYYLKPEEKVDLTNCDREPIHIIDHVQPHGALLVLDPDDLTIVRASQNTGSLFGIAAENLIGKSIDSLLAPDRVTELRTRMAEGGLEANPLYLFTTPLAGQGAFQIVVHLYRGALIIEIEPALYLDDQVTSPDHYSLIKKTLARLEKAFTVADFAQVVCEEIRRISGFDRVMVYRFLPDDSGHVIAEEIAPERQGECEPFLGLRYPASDIPRQARALFVLNGLRLIPDAGYIPAPLVPPTSMLNGRSSDLSYAFLRGVSAMHVEYLRNMGVQSTMSLSIVKEGALWGLIACHHYSPHRVAYDVRTACEFLARVVSLQIVEKERNEESEYRHRIEQKHHALIDQMTRNRVLVSALLESEENLRDFVDCGGCAVLLRDQCFCFGNTPDEAEIRALTNWLTVRCEDDIFTTHTLPAHFTEAEAFKDTACGVMALQFSYSGGGYVLWFRPELIQTVNWAGAPTKPSAADGGPLSPRRSFGLWQETVRDTAPPWKPLEIEAVRRLRVSIIENMARLVEQLAQANMKLERSNIELDAFAYIASHDMKEPLRGINNFSHFLKEDYGDMLPDEGREQLETILKLTKRMEALIDSLLYYSRVGRQDLAYDRINLNTVLQGVLDSLRLRILETGTEIRIPRPLPTVLCDQVQIGEVFANLIQNALKYNDKNTKWVEIGYTDDVPEAAHITFYVGDNGIGIEADFYEAIFRIFKRLHGRDDYGGGSGAGLTISRKIIDRHNGQIWVNSTPTVGSTFYFTLPKGK